MNTNQSTATNSGNTAIAVTISQPAGEGNSIGASQHWAETAVIGEKTRRLLVVWGKFNDAANEYADLIDEMYGGIGADPMLEGFMTNFSKISDEVLGMIPSFIVESREYPSDNQAII